MEMTLLKPLLVFFIISLAFAYTGDDYWNDYNYDDYDYQKKDSEFCCGSGLIILLALTGGALYGANKERG